jgi:hypothetical protein
MVRPDNAPCPINTKVDTVKNGEPSLMEAVCA